MTILLAPMQGLLDYTLRDILTSVGGIDLCVSEFIRVTSTLLPERTFRRIVPELSHGGCTAAGTPVRAQLLGSDPSCLAENAERLAQLGPSGIDLNFGCPANIVNRHGGGSALLDDPELLRRIVAAVRRAVPRAMPVSAKMRLGFNESHRAVECAIALADGGADELIVHARTKADGYKPPAYWERIAEIREAVAIPVIANGEIWSVADAMRCRAVSGCDSLMLGRGITSDPGLALAIVAMDQGHSDEPVLDWMAMQPLIAAYWALLTREIDAPFRAGRLKLWLKYLRRRHPEAQDAFLAVRTVTDPERIGEILALMRASCDSATQRDFIKFDSPTRRPTPSAWAAQ